MGDKVNHPSHYNTGEYEVIDYIQDKLTSEQFEGYCVGNILKYVSRYQHKNGVEDIKKAVWYASRMVSSMEDNAEPERNTMQSQNVTQRYVLTQK